MQSSTSPHTPFPVCAVEEVGEDAVPLPVGTVGAQTVSTTLRCVGPSLTTPLFTWTGPRSKQTPPHLSLRLHLFFHDHAGLPPMPLHVLAGITTITLSQKIMRTAHVFTRSFVFTNVQLMMRGVERVRGTCVQSNGLVRVFAALPPDLNLNMSAIEKHT